MKRSHQRLPDGVPRKQPGRKKSAERIEVEQFPCSTCDAAPGESCTTPRGWAPNYAYGHAPRWRAKEAAEAAAARNY